MATLTAQDFEQAGSNALSAALSALGGTLQGAAPPPASPAQVPGTAPAGAPQVLGPQESGFSINPWMIGIAAIVAVGVIVYIAKS